MQNWESTYALEHLEVQHSLTVHDVCLVATALHLVDTEIVPSSARREELRRAFRKRGYLLENEASNLLAQCNLNVYQLIAREILPILGYPQASAMRHELARNNIPVDYCLLLDCPARTPQSWNHLQTSRYAPEKLYWRRAVPADSVQHGRVRAYTHAFRIAWIDPEVRYPHPIYGFITAIGEHRSSIVENALYLQHLRQEMFGVL